MVRASEGCISRFLTATTSSDCMVGFTCRSIRLVPLILVTSSLQRSGRFQVMASLCLPILPINGSRVKGLPSFSLTRLGHVGEWLCISIKIGLKGMFLAPRDDQPPWYSISRTQEHMKVHRRIEIGQSLGRAVLGGWTTRHLKATGPAAVVLIIFSVRMCQRVLLPNVGSCGLLCSISRAKLTDDD